MPVNIIIFEDNESLRESLVVLLKSSAEFEVTGDFNNCQEAGNIIRRLNPDVVIMDIDLPEKSGIEGTRIIKETKPDVAVIMYTMFEDDKKIFESLCAGANGYILKTTTPYKLFDAIKEVMDGGAPMSPTVARRVLQSFQQKNMKQFYDLSKRENEILHLLTEGYSIKLIASELGIAYETVRSHLKNIYSKLHVNCGKEAIAKALKEKII
ncbi:MAG: response regulator transcription factor [Bacteroidota bacterium]|nr:response regulator transcription factor [Bacteroidota bacterium]